MLTCHFTRYVVVRPGETVGIWIRDAQWDGQPSFALFCPRLLVMLGRAWYDDDAQDTAHSSRRA